MGLYLQVCLKGFCLLIVRDSSPPQRYTTAMLPEKFSADMITWTLTIPAAWSVASRTSMRKAALQAGITTSIDSDALVLLRDTDAAALYSLKKEQNGLTKGSSFIVVDIGAAITDVTMHTVENLDDVLSLTESDHKAGMMIGSKLVDQVRILTFENR